MTQDLTQMQRKPAVTRYPQVVNSFYLSKKLEKQ